MSTIGHKQRCSPRIGDPQVPMTLKHDPVTSSGKSAPGPDPRIRHRTQIGMFRPIRIDHTNCLQVAIKSIQFKCRQRNFSDQAGRLTISHANLAISARSRNGSQGSVSVRVEASVYQTASLSTPVRLKKMKRHPHELLHFTISRTSSLLFISWT